MSKKTRELYIKRVLSALETSSKEMSRAEYVEALEEIQSAVESRLDAAREELRDR